MTTAEKEGGLGTKYVGLDDVIHNRDNEVRADRSEGSFKSRNSLVFWLAT